MLVAALLCLQGLANQPASIQNAFFSASKRSSLRTRISAEMLDPHGPVGSSKWAQNWSSPCWLKLETWSETWVFYSLQICSETGPGDALFGKRLYQEHLILSRRRLCELQKSFSEGKLVHNVHFPVIAYLWEGTLQSGGCCWHYGFLQNRPK